jgi:hypothetical protein
MARASLRQRLRAPLRAPRLAIVLAPIVLAAACKPNLGSPPSLIEGTRILAVRGMPPEAGEGTMVTYDILAVNQMGRIADPSVQWAVCRDPKPPASANAVANSCVTAPNDTMMPSATFMAPMPSGDCKVFGPQPPEVMAGKPPLRPQDPDVTGGFYQPVRATLTDGADTAIAFALERLKCPLTNASADVTAMFNMMIKPNQNPAIASVTLDPGGAATPLFTMKQATAPAMQTATAGAPITLEVAWTADTPETYPVYDLVTQQIETHRESLSVSWFATDGSFEHDRTGRGETETDLTSDNVWTAPPNPGVVHFWVLLRDIRGGVDFAETALMVQP